MIFGGNWKLRVEKNLCSSDSSEHENDVLNYLIQEKEVISDRQNIKCSGNLPLWKHQNQTEYTISCYKPLLPTSDHSWISSSLSV